ncbi:MAG: hypothetical protein ACD_48C00153G0001 [uncultured bacterium]|nr:MAG: hypothetical protein ACD_48C00153G0001 [uncultured bacterium]
MQANTHLQVAKIKNEISVLCGLPVFLMQLRPEAHLTANS